MIKTLFSFIAFFIVYAGALGQHYNYQHYDISNGLSGLTVYKIVQDKDGFIWFATETGLSRFDGTSFKNFSTTDGLPDNEILDLYVDSKNRVWILPFAHSLCYYKGGKIYTQKNDTLLSKIKFTAEPLNIIEDDKDNFVVLERDCLHVLTHEGKTWRYDSIRGGTFSTFGVGLAEKNVFSIPIAFGPTHQQFGFMRIHGTELNIDREADGRLFSLSNKVNIILNKNVEVFRYPDSFRIEFKNEQYKSALITPEHLIGLSPISDSTFSLNSSDNVLLYNIHKKQIADTFNLGKIVNCSFRDNEGNYWFATNGYGVYRLTTTAFLNYNLVSGNNQLPVYSLSKSNENILAGTSQALLWTINLYNKSITNRKVAGETGEARITGIANKKDKLIIGSGSSDAIRYFDESNEHIVFKGTSTKKIYTDDTEVLVATNIGVYKMHFDKPEITDSMWLGKRSTCAIGIEGTYYIGTLNGLYSIDKNKTELFLGQNEPLLTSRVSAITKDKDALWIATYGNGIIGYKSNKVIVHITEKDGLTSNMCRDICFDNGKIWVATDKGLNKIDVSQNAFKINTYTTKDGLNSDLINCLLVSNDSVFIGTPYGLVFLKPGDIDTNSIAILNVNAIGSSKNKWSGKENHLQLAAGDNMFFIDFSCISFKSQSNITYYYRLLGLDTDWHTTKENTIDFASLPPGAYQFELYAINAFGKKSNIINIEFAIDKFFYQETWFDVLIGIILFTAGWFFVSERIKQIQKNERAKLQTQKRLSELEQLAFRSQMNPHFIFNCLNSIQQYIFTKSEIETNRFITEFSSLIRQTLDLSSKKEITLEEEIKYLDTYLKLEHTRSNKNYDYTIFTEPQMTPETIYLPPLLLQPFVENSIRHGVRNLKDRKGKIYIGFSIENGYLVCIVEDNGIGREAALKLRGENPVGTQSKGMSLIQKRIEALNMENNKDILLKVEDVLNGGEKSGTKITLKLPFS